MTQEFPLNSTRKFKIFMADSTNPLVGKTGLTTFTVYLAKDSAAEATVSPSIVERGRGWYEVTPIAAHRDTLGQSAWTFTATGAVDYPVKEVVVSVDAQTANWGVIAAMGTGTFLTQIPWNAAWDAEVQSEVEDALSAGTQVFGHSYLEAFRRILVKSGSRLSGAGTGTEVQTSTDSSKTVTWTVDTSGNITAEVWT